MFLIFLFIASSSVLVKGQTCVDKTGYEEACKGWTSYCARCVFKLILNCIENIIFQFLYYLESLDCLYVWLTQVTPQVTPM